MTFSSFLFLQAGLWRSWPNNSILLQMIRSFLSQFTPLTFVDPSPQCNAEWEFSYVLTLEYAYPSSSLQQGPEPHHAIQDSTGSKLMAALIRHATALPLGFMYHLKMHQRS